MYVIMYMSVNITIMNNNTTISISEGRKRIFEIAEDVQKPGTQYTLTENGKPKAVVMSAEEFESWQETLNVMRDFPELKKDIAQAEREYEAGKYITLESLLTREGFIVADRGAKKYEIHSRPAAKGAKRARRAR